MLNETTTLANVAPTIDYGFGVQRPGTYVFPQELLCTKDMKSIINSMKTTNSSISSIVDALLSLGDTDGTTTK